MEISILFEFLTLAEIGNYMEAADRLFISQSTLTRHIQILEKELGHQLFNRSTRHLEINEYGKMFIPYAMSITRSQMEYTHALSEMNRLLKGKLTIGAMPYLHSYGIDDFLIEFKKENPSFFISVIESSSKKLLEKIKHNEVDFAFVFGNSFSDEFNVIPYAHDSMVAVLKSDHPLANYKSVTLEQLKNEVLFLTRQNSLGYTQAIESCRAAGFEPIVSFMGNDRNYIRSMVEQGYGIGLFMKRPAQEIINPRICLVDLVPEIVSDISVVYLKNSAMRISSEYFLQHMKTMLGSREIC